MKPDCRPSMDATNTGPLTSGAAWSKTSKACGFGPAVGIRVILCMSLLGSQTDENRWFSAANVLHNWRLTYYHESMGSSVEKTVIRSRQAPEPVLIVNWPLRDEGLWSLLLITVFMAIAALCGSISGRPALGALSFAMLALSAWRLWVPVAFSVSSRGITQTIFGRQRRISWPQIARYKVYPGGVLLLADSPHTPLAALRGLYIRWNGRRDELLELVQYFLDTRYAVTGSTRSFSGQFEERQLDQAE